MHLYSNNLPAIAKMFCSIILESLPACFFCNNNPNLSQSLIGSDHKNIVF